MRLKTLPVALLFLVCAAPAATLSPDPAAPAARLPEDKSSLQDWARRHRLAAAPLREGVEIAHARLASLRTVLASDPQAVPAQALSLEEYAALPAEIRDASERPVSAVGDYLVLCATPPAGSSEPPRLQRFVRLEGQVYPAIVYGRRLEQQSKTAIPLQGVLVDGTFVMDENAIQVVDAATLPPAMLPPGGTPAGTVLGRAGGRIFRFADRTQLARTEAAIRQSELAPGPAAAHDFEAVIANPAVAAVTLTNTWANGPKTLLVIRVDFSDLPGVPYTDEYCRQLMDEQIAPFYASASYGKTSLVTTVAAKTYRLSRTAEYYATNDRSWDIETEAKALAAVDYPGAYDRYLFVFASFSRIAGSKFNWAGLGQVSGRSTWYNGDFTLRVASHELGHNCGVVHANLWKVSDGDPISDGGVHQEYNDPYDTQGGSGAGGMTVDFNPSFKRLYGWLDSAQIAPLTRSGVYHLRAFDHNAPRAGDIVALTYKKNDARTYYISYRGGWKSTYNTTPAANIQEGAYVFWTQDASGSDTEMLDMTPRTTSALDGALTPGTRFTDMQAGLAVSTLGVSGTGPDRTLDVEVTFFDPKRMPIITVSDAVYGGSTTIATRTVTPPLRTQLYIDGALWAESTVPNATFTWEPEAIGAHTILVKASYADGVDLTNLVSVNTPAPSNWAWIIPKPQGNAISAMVHANDQWWAVAGYGGLQTSADGRTWSAQPLTTSAPLQGIATDGTQIIIGTGGYDAVASTSIPSLWRSTDGKTWSEIKGVTNAIQSVYYLNRTWVAASGGQITTSTDGVTWTSFRQLLSQNWYNFDLAYDNGLWVAAFSNGTVCTSPDLVTWTQAPAIPELMASECGGVSSLNGQWMVAFYGSVNGTYGAVACLTKDFTTWTRVPLTGAGWVSFAGVIDDQFAVASYGCLLLSKDGMTWTRLLYPSLSINALGKANGLYVATGDRGLTWLGATLDRLQVADAQPRLTLNGCLELPDGSVVFSTNGYSSTDSRSYASALLVANGTTQPANAPTGRSCYGPVYRDGTYVMVSSGAALTSSDGRTWVEQSLSPGISLYGVATTDTGFVAVGSAGTILISRDGKLWSSRPSGVEKTFYGVGTDPSGKMVVAVGDAGLTVVSRDSGLTWTAANQGHSAYQRQVVWQDGLGFCTLGNGDLYTSPDGMTWSKRGLGYWSYHTASPHGLILTTSGCLGITTDGVSVSRSYLPDSGGRPLYAGNTVFVASNGGLLALSLKGPNPRPLAITTQPQSQDVRVGQPAVLRVEATGTGPFSYQWRRDGTPLMGATSATLQIQAVGKLDAGDYCVTIRNPAGSTTSAVAKLTVREGPIRIISGPASQTGAPGAGASFSVNATSDNGVPLTYQWYLNDVAIVGATDATYLASVSARAYGRYTVKISAGSDWVTQTTTLAPLVALQKVAPAVTLIPNATFAATVRDVIEGVTYQWYRDGAPIVGAVGPTYLGHAGASGSATYAVRGSINGVWTDSESLTVTATQPVNAGHLANLSALSRTAAGAEALTIGFVTNGATNLLVRGIGPTLDVFPVPGFVPDPQLELYGASGLLAQNDNWGGTPALRDAISACGAFGLQPTSKDAALLAQASGLYSARVTATDGGAGIALVEVYDTTRGAFTEQTPRLVNLSCRTNLGTDTGMVTVGFVVGGDTARTVLIRAVGPGLGLLGVTNYLADPKLTLFTNQTELAANDNWGGTVPSAVFTATSAFGLPDNSSKDAALVITLPPGSYTAQVVPASASSGLVLVEVYEVR
ncbi:immunoglobulin domain-containing protein [Opitutus sp. ER46]|uniref:immunoglobulin domain-containing protein n=1 Tax=Opitutus sp. ER46 TaxID=2161864 RepID=UPI000D4EF545|nr:immunoglobulin domain-containing protein [Opitutus sp. ER46]PTX98518.1 hypothetical protein DB354_04440 [Opitutus sp. ER46]